MKSKTLTKILDGEFNAEMTADYFNYPHLQNKCEQLKEQGIVPYDYKDFIKTIKNSKYYPLFCSICDNIKSEYIYKSFTHGIFHNERVAMFSLFMAEKLKLAETDAKIAIYAALYHDIGRENDMADDFHGTRSAKLIDKLNLPLDSESLKILKIAITYHSLADSHFYDNLDGINTDRQRTIMAFNILKDADGLDRVRLGGGKLDLRFLRTAEALRLVPSAFQLEYNYMILNKKAAKS